jgi:hypothetical protein
MLFEKESYASIKSSRSGMTGMDGLVQLYQDPKTGGTTERGWNERGAFLWLRNSTKKRKSEKYPSCLNE